MTEQRRCNECGKSFTPEPIEEQYEYFCPDCRPERPTLPVANPNWWLVVLLILLAAIVIGISALVSG